MWTGTPFSFSCCRNGGRYPCSRAISTRPFDGPASHVSIPPSDAHTSASATIGTRRSIPKWLKNSLNACITPAVRLSSYAGTTQLIAKAGRMKISSTRPVAMNIAFGNSLPGLRSDETCTEFISIPE